MNDEKQKEIVFNEKDVKYIDIEDNDLMMYSLFSKIFGSIVVFIISFYIVNIFLDNSFPVLVIAIVIVFIYFNILDDVKEDKHKIEIVRSFENDIYYLIDKYKEKLENYYDVIFFNYKNILIEVQNNQISKILYIKKNELLKDFQNKTIVEIILLFQLEFEKLYNANPEFILLGNDNLEVLSLNSTLNTGRIVPIRKELREAINKLLLKTKVEYSNEHLDYFYYIYRD